MAGCAAGPDYRAQAPGQLGAPARFVSAPQDRPAEDIAQWWTAFDDPELSRLIDLALADNLDIAQAAARLKQAREALAQAQALRLPSLGVGASAGRNVNGPLPDTTSYGADLQASWSADLFGGLRRSAEASRANLQAAGFSLADVRTAVAAEVAGDYIDARALKQRIAIANDALRTQDNNLQIARWRSQAGLVSGSDVEQARVQREQTASTIPLLDTAYAAARYRISVLTGQAPGSADATFAPAAPIPTGPEVIAAGLPADLVRRRPDVRASERNLAAATAQIGVAEAQLYPQLTLSGQIGPSILSAGGPANWTGGVFAALAQSIFDGGQRRAAVRSQKAAVEQALAAYRSTVLAALEQSENALVARRSAQTRQEALANEADAANNAAILARSAYRAGLTDFQTLLEAERSLLGARDGLADAQAERAKTAVQLYLALGGGWSPAPSAPVQ